MAESFGGRRYRKHARQVVGRERASRADASKSESACYGCVGGAVADSGSWAPPGVNGGFRNSIQQEVAPLVVGKVGWGVPSLVLNFTIIYYIMCYRRLNSFECVKAVLDLLNCFSFQIR